MQTDSPKICTVLPKRGKKDQEKGMGCREEKTQAVFLKPALPEDVLFLTEMICYIGRPNKGLCAFYAMHEKCVINLMLP